MKYKKKDLIKAIEDYESCAYLINKFNITDEEIETFIKQELLDKYKECE